MDRGSMWRRGGDGKYLGVAFVVTLLLEAALVERKFAIFGGGYGQPRVLDSFAEIATFIIGLIITHLAFLLTIYGALRRLHGRHGDPALLRYNFLCLGVVAYDAFLIAKFEVLAYFSDAISFNLIRELGGGSLIEAAVYTLSESGLMIATGVVILVGYALGYRLIGRSRSNWMKPRALRIGKIWLALLLAIPLLVLTANTVPETRYALTRYTAYAGFNALLNAATDFDRDGYSWFSAQIDRQPFDAARHPLALDVPGNGIDEDGFGGDLMLGPVAQPVRYTLPEKPKHLILVTLESVRGDVIGARVNGKVVAPNLEALARTGSRFPHVYSHVGFTTASIKSLFTGVLEPVSGQRTLLDTLKEHGYHIAVFSGGAESFGGIDETTGMRRTSDIFIDAERLRAERALSFGILGSLRIDESILLREFDQNVGKADAWTRPQFVYLNFQAAHFPYHHAGMPDLLGIDPLPRSQISAENHKRVAETYWNAVAYADHHLGLLIKRLKAMGVWEDTLLIVTADHGEALFDDGVLGHGHVIDSQQTRIPLVANVPGLARDAPIGIKDIAGVILAALSGAPAPTPDAPVLLHIGPLDAPVVIGMVEAGGVFTTLAFETEEVRLGEGEKRIRYDRLRGADKARADRLVTLWGRERWIARSSGGNAQ